MTADETAIDRRCVFCGSPDVDLWKSWNLVGEWVCADCALSDRDDADDPDDGWWI